MEEHAPLYRIRRVDWQELPGLSITVDNVVYDPHLDAPTERPFPFSYSLTIHNDSPQAVQIKGRKWVLTDLADGRRQVIEGDGVAGKCPRLLPGESFTFETYHTIAADSSAVGALFGCTAAGNPVLARIPLFFMHIPR